MKDPREALTEWIWNKAMANDDRPLEWITRWELYMLIGDAITHAMVDHRYWLKAMEMERKSERWKVFWIILAVVIGLPILGILFLFMG